ncbi:MULTISPECIES: BREX system ATP-binding protein BrxD [Actinomycetes]|uniref:BREX system ATP-binding protein BrxD n=1 Tax=Actinomycetes TaxID=1760 RepID=UPI0004C1E06F|nr:MULTISPECIES: BREX system ATP-binding protein BrxD [Actinomycetes]
MTPPVSARRRREILDALRRGTVPSNGLDQLAVGLGRFEQEMDNELQVVAGGGGVFKAVRGEYGSGKTFFARWMADRAMKNRFAVAEVQINEIDTPLHKLETVYRRSIESLRTASVPPSALRPILDSWLFTIESDAEQQNTDPDVLLERRLASVATHAPIFPIAIRAYRKFVDEGDESGAEGLVAWLGGQPHVAASIKRRAGIRGDLDHFLALGFLRGLLAVLADSGYAGLLLVLDEVETLQRIRSDARAKALNALRQLVDEVHDGSFPGLYLMITGTPAFFEGRQGISLLPPLADRLHTEFSSDPRFDNPRAPQIRLTGFTTERLVELGRRVRDLFVTGLNNPERVQTVADDEFIERFATSVAGHLGGRVGIAPRLFLRKLVDVLDKIEQFDDFDPYQHYEISIADGELSDAEREALTAGDIDVDL